MRVMEIDFINDKIIKFLKDNFENVKVNKKTVKFGAVSKKSYVYTLTLNDNYGSIYLKVSKRKSIGNFDDEETMLLEKIVSWDSTNKFYNDIDFASELILQTISKEDVLENLKNNNKYEEYIKEVLTEEEKETMFASLLITIALEGKLEEMYRNIHYGIPSTDSLFKYIQFNRDVEFDSTFKLIAKRIDENRKHLSPFYAEYGFDFYDFRHQILKNFFEKRNVLSPCACKNVYLLKDFDKIQC